MADSDTFQWARQELARLTPLSELEAAGVLTMGLREAGLESRTLTPVQFEVVLRQILPEKLRRQAIDGPEQVCSSLARSLGSAQLSTSGQAQNPEDVLRRVTRR